MAFSPDGSLLAVGDSERTVRLWLVRTGELLHTLKEDVTRDSPVFQLVRSLKGGGFGTESIAFAPDGGLLAGAYNDGTVKLWDTRTGDLAGVLEGHEGYVHSVAFSPNGKLVASGSGDSTVRIWSLSTCRLLTTTAFLAANHWVVYTPDGYYDGSDAVEERVMMAYRYAEIQLPAVPKRNPERIRTALSGQGAPRRAGPPRTRHQAPISAPPRQLPPPRDSR